MVKLVRWSQQQTTAESLLLTGSNLQPSSDHPPAPPATKHKGVSKLVCIANGMGTYRNSGNFGIKLFLSEGMTPSNSIFHLINNVWIFLFWEAIQLPKFFSF